MRDLFQVVFELKKKEVEMAKQQLEGKTVTSSLVRHATIASTESKTKVIKNSHTKHSFLDFFFINDCTYAVINVL